MSGGMPITSFLAGRTFEPEQIAVMSAAFANTCKALGLEADHALMLLVAQQLWDWAREALKPRLCCTC